MCSIFEAINARADAIKAAKWAAYQPLARRQLKDETRVEAQTNTEMVTLDVGAFGQFVVLKRPTETDALRWQNHRDTIVKRKPTVEWRWCIWCKCRHPFEDFRYSPKHYLHGYSYACKKAINDRRERNWRYLGQSA